MLRQYRLAAVAVTLVLPAALQAQGGVAGKWIVDFHRSVRNENGVMTTGDPARARMTFEQRGDSVFGTWVLLSPVEDPMPAPRHLKGAITNGAVRVVSDPSPARVRDESGEREIKITTTYEFKVNGGGDELSGTQQSRPVAGGDGPPPRPFAAKREKP